MQREHARLSVLGAILCAACLLPAIRPAPAQEDHWPRFRGPNGAGVYTGKFPATWTGEDYAWKVDLPGPGHSSPVIWGNRLFLTCGDERSGARIVLCFDADTGKRLWRREYAAKTHGKHKLNTFASATPALDPQRVYVSWATPEEYVVLALAHEGRELWRVDLGPFKTGHGFGASPIVHDGLLVVPNEHEGDSFLTALDCATGETRWKVPRNSRVTYSTPCVFRRRGHGPELIFTNWTHGITALDPRTGEQNWEIKVFGPELETAIGSPVVAGDLVIGCCGYLGKDKHVVAVRPEAGASRPQVEEVYHFRRSTPLTTTPLVVGNLLFLWSDEGIVTCADAAGGQVHWKRRVSGTYYGSPVAAGVNGRDATIYCVSADGEVAALAASREYRLLGRTDLGAASNSTPAFARGKMYLRTVEKLMALK